MIDVEQFAFLDSVIDCLKKDNFSGIRFYVYEESEEFYGLSESEILEKEFANEQSFFVEAGKNGKRCYTYLNQQMDPENVKNQMNISFEGASRDYEYHSYKKSVLYSTKAQSNPTEEEIVKVLKESMEEAKNQSAMVIVDECSFSISKQKVHLVDEEGHCMSDCHQSMSARSGIIVRNGADVATAWGNLEVASLEKEPMKQLARETVEKALNGLNSSSIQSGKYRAILSNSVCAELWEAYLPVFFADMVQDQMSHYTDRLGDRIASEEVLLFEDPTHPLGRCQRSIDDEGNQVSKKELIQNGRLKSFLYNEETAKKANQESTGNGFKTSLTGDVGIQYTNVVCTSKIGNQASVLLQKLGTGVFVRQVDGVFAGVNINNGDFSLIAKGNLVENGQILNSFCDVTIAGNFFQLIKEIEGFGIDHCCTPKGYGSVVCPSLLVNEITISGL